MSIILKYEVSKDGVYVCSHRQNAMCVRNHDALLDLEPLSSYTIRYMGSEEGEDEFEDDDYNDIRLDDWIKENPAEVTFKTFVEGSRVSLRKGKLSGKIITVVKGKWSQEYNVLLDSGEHVTVSQMQISAPKAFNEINVCEVDIRKIDQ
jgi:hypothetical protein